MRRLILLAALSFVACGPDPEPRPQRPAAGTWRQAGNWSGRGNQQLETFAIEGGAMRLHWETRQAAGSANGVLKVRIQSGDSGRVLAEPVDVRGAGRDTVDLTIDHHRVYLTVESADLDWSIRVETATLRAR